MPNKEECLIFYGSKSSAIQAGDSRFCAARDSSTPVLQALQRDFSSLHNILRLSLHVPDLPPPHLLTSSRGAFNRPTPDSSNSNGSNSNSNGSTPVPGAINGRANGFSPANGLSASSDSRQPMSDYPASRATPWNEVISSQPMRPRGYPASINGSPPSSSSPLPAPPAPSAGPTGSSSALHSASPASVSTSTSAATATPTLVKPETSASVAVQLESQQASAQAGVEAAEVRGEKRGYTQEDEG